MKIDHGRIRRTGVLGLLVLLAACGDAQADGPDGGPEDGAREAYTRIINVEVDVVESRTFVEQIRLTGVALANRDVTIAAEESGTVTRILVEKGSRVRAGQPLLQIDDRVLQSQVDQARAAAALARETWERRKRLWEEDQVGSELAYLEARYASEQAQANLRNLEERLARTVIRAPIEGILENRLVEQGSLLSPGTPVARIVDVDPVKITAGVPERYAPDVRVGASAQVGFDVLPQADAETEVTFVGAAVDARNRTFPVEVTLPNPDGLIKPEMVASVAIARRRVDEAVVVPQEAVVRVQDGYVVFVVEGEAAEAVARARPVTVGPSQANEVVVTEGLEPGDRLVVAGQNNVADGDRVRVVGGVR